MIALLANLWLRHVKSQETPSEVRRIYGVLCGIVAIFLNLFLFVGKFWIGHMVSSISITADAFNNLSDAGSSVVSLLGFHLAGQPPDKEHPFGHNRMEYISGLVIALLILWMGLELLEESVEKILHPVPVTFSPMIFQILLLSISVKFYMFCYHHVYGKKFHSPTLKATAKDSLSDCAATATVLLSALLERVLSLPTDGYCGMLVALLILLAGISSMRETINPLLGQAPDPLLLKQIQEIALRYPSIHGVHDIIVHDYGPSRCMVTLHAEVPAHGDISYIHAEIDEAEQQIWRELDCIATIHMDPIVTDDILTVRTHAQITALLQNIYAEIQIHDFRAEQKGTAIQVTFDAAVPYAVAQSDSEIQSAICNAIHAWDSQYHVTVHIDRT